MSEAGSRPGAVPIVLNGRSETVEPGTTIGRLLELRGLPRPRVAVEVDGRIVRKADYDAVALRGGERVEVVSFVGGG